MSEFDHDSPTPTPATPRVPRGLPRTPEMELLMRFASEWDAVGVMGFVNSHQERVPALLAVVKAIRDYVAAVPGRLPDVGATEEGTTEQRAE